MMNQHTGHSTAKEFYRIPPALAGVPADDVTEEEEDQPVRFGRRVNLADYGEIERTFKIKRKIATMMPRMAESSSGKIFLPRRSGEPRFGPQQYYYAASKTGVVPS